MFAALKSFRSAKLERKIVSCATKTIDIGCYLRCLPYRRLARDSVISSPLHLRRDSGYLFPLCMGMVWIHVSIQWLAFIRYTKEHGMDTSACLHLNFLAIYNLSAMFALQMVIYPEGMMTVQNEIYGMQQSFQKSWTLNPLMVFLIPFLQVLLLVVPVISVCLFLIDPALPMFAVSSVVLDNSSDDELRGILSTGKVVVTALLEAFLLFYSVVIIFSVSQTCAILEAAINTWLADRR